MKFVSLSFIIGLLLLQTAFAQQKVAPNMYVVYFKDKLNSPYSVDKPQEFLSEKAILRRQKYNISITEQDIPVNKSYTDSLEKSGFKIRAVSKWLNCAVVETEANLQSDSVNLPDFTCVKEQIKKEKKQYKPEKHKAIKITGEPDTFFYYDYGYGKSQTTIMNLHNLHNKGFNGKNLDIALLDAGFKNVDKIPGFDSLRTKKQILGIRDFVDRDTDVYEDASHGMQVLSTIAANLPGKLVGTAPEANFWLLRTETEHSEYLVEEYFWIAGAEFADSAGADILHSSLGYNDFDDTTSNFAYSDMNGDIAPATIAADIAASKGILVTCSAGNEGKSSWKYITSPADADSTLTVGAVSARNVITDFSSRGPAPDGRIKPEIVAQGAFTWVLKPKRGINFAFGTSFSGPIIAGAVACLWQAHPRCTNMEIIDAVIKSADRYTNPDNEYGYGLPDFDKADKYLKEKGK